jgi:hypothetical protein
MEGFILLLVVAVAGSFGLTVVMDRLAERVARQPAPVERGRVDRDR